MVIDRDLLKRNDKKIQSLLVDKKDKIETKETLYLLYPKRYEVKRVAKIGITVEIVGAVLLMNKQHEYTVITLPNLIEFEPVSIESVKLNGAEYVVCEFIPPVFINNVDVIDDADVPFTLLDEFLLSGRIPFYLEISDILKIFSKGAKTTGAKFTKTIILVELLLAMIARDKSGKLNARSVYNKKELTSSNIRWVGLKEVDLFFRNTPSRILGNYFNKALTIAVTDDNPDESDLDTVLKL